MTLIDGQIKYNVPRSTFKAQRLQEGLEIWQKYISAFKNALQCSMLIKCYNFAQTEGRSENMRD